MILLMSIVNLRCIDRAIFLNTFVLYFHLEHVQRIGRFVAVSLFLTLLFFVLMMALFYG